MSNGTEPSGIHSLPDLKEAFDSLRRAQGRHLGKERLSVQDLARRLSRSEDGPIPRSTLANYLAGRTLPPPGAYESILRALGIPHAELSAWANAWDRVHDHNSGPDPHTAPAAPPARTDAGPPGRRRWPLWRTAVVAATLLAGGTSMMALLSSEKPTTVATPTPTGQAAGECAYSPVAAPIRVRPRPTFKTGTEFHTISQVEQVVIGACTPQHAESGTTCSAQTVPIDTWIPVRFPYTGWVFSAYLQRIAPPPP
ncbi:helix-turn-helix domain-containing protein [Amycolatopsis magusensis]|uniref:Helix-turn-helix domain-containing protein n=1 Tax=Amycolatopsis magusensis TaxID=882444 RepID=A0ABS4PU17_9PSEU|nr:helix-turn-helix transcriptional regulator [Amycolatopsis magusensis]MBP2182926.1 hypothetical protein [Amycolatopsis magusensis]